MSASIDELRAGLRCTAQLMDYPDSAWRGELTRLRGQIELLPSSDTRKALISFVDEAQKGDPIAFEKRYVELFDMGRTTNLCLTGRNRVYAAQQRADMIAYSIHYEALGMEPSNEPPDYLPALLDLAAMADAGEVRSIFRTAGKDLEALRAALAGAGVPDYEMLVTTVQRIAHELEQEVA